MARTKTVTLTSPMYAEEWINLGSWKTDVGDASARRGFLEATWEHHGYADALTHREELIGSLERLGGELGDLAPDSHRYVRMAAPYSDPSVVTVTLVERAVPIPDGAPRIEQVAGGVILRGREPSHEIHAAFAGAPAPHDSLDRLFAKVGINVVRKGGFLGGLRETADFFGFWSPNGA